SPEGGRLLPLLVKRKADEGPVICVWTSHGQKGTHLVFLDARGRELQRVPVQFALDAEARAQRRRDRGLPLASFSATAFQVWNHAGRGEGEGDLCLFVEPALGALGPDLNKSRGEGPWPAARSHLRALGRAGGGGPATVVVRAGQAVYGLAGTTGKPVWRCVG